MGLNNQLLYNDGWGINKNDGKKRRVGFVGVYIILDLPSNNL